MDAQSRVRSQVWPDGTGGYGATPRSSIDLPGLTNYLAGCGRTRLGRTVARWSARLWTPGEHFRRVAERDWRDGRDERDARVRCPKFEVFGTSNPELRTSNFELRIAPFSHVSRFTHQTPSPPQAASRPPSFEVPLLGLTNSSATRYPCDWRGTQGGHHDLHTLSGLYGQRSLLRSHGERRKYVAGRLALPQLRKRPIDSPALSMKHPKPQHQTQSTYEDFHLGRHSWNGHFATTGSTNEISDMYVKKQKRETGEKDLGLGMNIYL